MSELKRAHKPGYYLGTMVRLKVKQNEVKVHNKLAYVGHHHQNICCHTVHKSGIGIKHHAMKKPKNNKKEEQNTM